MFIFPMILGIGEETPLTKSFFAAVDFFSLLFAPSGLRVHEGEHNTEIQKNEDLIEIVRHL